MFFADRTSRTSYMGGGSHFFTFMMHQTGKHACFRRMICSYWYCHRIVPEGGVSGSKELFNNISCSFIVL